MNTLIIINAFHSYTKLKYHCETQLQKKGVINVSHKL